MEQMDWKILNACDTLCGLHSLSGQDTGTENQLI